MDAVASTLIQAATAVHSPMLDTAQREALGTQWAATVDSCRSGYAAGHPATALLDELRGCLRDTARAASLASQLQTYRPAEHAPARAAAEQLAATLTQHVHGAATVNAKVINGAGVVYGNVTQTIVK